MLYFKKYYDHFKHLETNTINFLSTHICLLYIYFELFKKLGVYSINFVLKINKTGINYWLIEIKQ